MKERKREGVGGGLTGRYGYVGFIKSTEIHAHCVKPKCIVSISMKTVMLCMSKINFGLQIIKMPFS